MAHFHEITPRKVWVSPVAVALFNAQWPASTLRSSRAYWFEFDDIGLIDTDCPEHDDGPAAKAMADDCFAFLEDGTRPDWLNGLEG
jgi:hypothetical protein